MIPLVPTLALAFLSFTCSVFVILRIVIPILPPHPLSRRVAPSEFGLPNFKKLVPADKAHLWIASCDVLALVVFIWQVIAESLGGPSNSATAVDALAAVRLWFASTLRATCVLIIITMTLLHVRLARPVDFGKSHWLIWGPGLLLIVTSTGVAGVLAGADFPSFFIGMIAYSSSLTFIGVAVLAALVGTLVTIRRNLTSTAELDDSWPPMRQVDQERHSFAQEDIDGLKEGSSWITSDAGSCHGGSVSAFSFSTHQTHARRSSNGSSNFHHGHAPPKSTFWSSSEVPGRISPVPPVPPLPAPYRPASPSSASVCDDPDPFRRTIGNDPRVRGGSQASWLTEPSVAPSTATAWSFPATRPPTRSNTPAMFPRSTADLHAQLLRPAVPSRPQTPAITSAQVLGGYGFSDVSLTEKQAGLAAVPEGDLDIGVARVMIWFISALLPCALALPYFVSIHLTGTASAAASILMILSITLPPPFLALCILLHWSLPVPSGLFESTAQPMPELARASSPTLARPWSHEYKRSGSVTVVEGRRSGDVWITNGDAVDGKNKVGRAFELLNAKPKLSVLPLANGVVKAIDGELTPPLPLQSAPNSVPSTPVSENSEELGRKKSSKASSYYSGTDETQLHTARVMVAQKHYSALAMTMVVPPSPDPEGKSFASPRDEVETTGIASGVAIYERSDGRSHCRTRSTSSVSTSRSRNVISPPPAFPLPPTPPSVKAARAMAHKRSYSSGLSMTEIDALSAGILPKLVPGLKIGEGVRISGDWRLSSASHIRGSMTGRTFDDFLANLPNELGGAPGEFSSPEFHSTPATNGKKVGQRTRKASHKRQHFSLPSLSLGKDCIQGLSTWITEINNGSEVPVEEERRNTVIGEQHPETGLDAVREVDELSRPSSPFHTQDPATARSSMATLINALDNEFKLGLYGIDEDASLDFDASGPLAHSTPHESHKPASRSPVPPVPKSKSTKANRRSSITYIKSDENAIPPSNATNDNTSRKSLSPTKRLAEISSRAVKPLMSRNKRKTKDENASSTTNTTTIAALPSNGKDVLTASHGGGLRPLSLLQDRDVNRSAQPGLGVVAEDSITRPLDLKKKQKNFTGSRALANGAVAGKDENENIHAIRLVSGAASDPKGLKPLKLARSETSKQRAILRKNEVLPSVVVRPPSQVHGALDLDYRMPFH